MALRVEGHAGELRVGYQVAAELGPWRLILAPQLPRQYEVSAAVLTISDYWLGERPLTLVVAVGSDLWSWTPVEPAIEGRALTAVVVGAPTIIRGVAPRVEEMA